MRAPEVHRRGALAAAAEPGRVHARDEAVRLRARARRAGRAEAARQPRQTFSSLADVFERRSSRTGRQPQIDALYETAFHEKAFAAVAELQWFLTEQVEEEKTGREIVAKLQMIGDDPASLLDMDRELGSRTGCGGQSEKSE